MAALAAIPMAVSAHADTPASPYTGQQTRSIKALSPEDMLSHDGKGRYVRE